MKSLLVILLFTFSALLVTAQNVGIGTASPLARLHVADSSVLFAAAGVVPSTTGKPPAEGAGRRMMWYADKAAFRTGYTSTNMWDKDSIGSHSFAAGFNTKATGFASHAMGNQTTASGPSSIVMGFNSIARGDIAIAMGNFTAANGNSSTAMGAGTIAGGYASTAMGYGSVANSNTATTMGRFTNATGYASTATGDSSEASGAISFASGLRSKASGDYATAMGYLNVASENASTAMGNQTTASGSSSTAMGFNSAASGGIATAMGNFTIASGHSSTAMGAGTLAAGYASSAMGYNARSLGYAGTAIGMNNNPMLLSGQSVATASTPLFIIGNGDNTGSLSNAMIVLKSGNVGIGTNAPKTNLHIEGGTDASLSDNSGYLVTGSVTSTNIVMDNNEILARNNGANATLFFQNSGGALETGGTASKPGGGSWLAISDARMKEKLQPYSDGLEKLLQINPVYFKYNTLSGYNTAAQHIGVVAQELQQVAPYMVGTFTKNNTEYLNVDNTAMTYMLINAVKEQQKQIELLTQKIKELEVKR